ncbi:MAG: class I SAM-dependent methyltransferase [Kiritimatiellae bacterium]|nr:class I SAM-dependent methyltransferase [Kiritimatiellia bacterium]
MSATGPTGRCRACGEPLRETFCDLGTSPLANAYVRPEQAKRAEPFYPLHAWVCTACWLVQLEEFEPPEAIFSDYAYFSSYSDSWVEHARRYVDAMIERFGLTPGSTRVVEVASNDGYLLQFFRRRGFEVLGVEPAANVAAEAIARGIPTIVRFFGERTARELVAEYGAADWVVANNVLAHVPDINDFVAGFRLLLRPGGTWTAEFAWVVELVRRVAFDTIYHEHFSYLSLTFLDGFLPRHGLRLFDAEALPTHGGSLRIYVCHAEDPRPASERLARLLAEETALGLRDPAWYRGFGPRVAEVKFRLLEYLIGERRAGRRVVGYGAPAKGNTLLNYAGVKTDLLEFTCDRNPHKQGCFLPGTRIPIRPPEAIWQARPDRVLILPWNIADEVMSQLAHIREWGGRFVVPIPSVEELR